ncbi:hypothetical protein FA15DRAFT_675845 [Coprinopsis marcescibilis]|uniref:Uncharacterized protein n=1 Tax=Coprinopsis marcescibilis TaxID=230819 RepID=A0A5C3KDM9_COPMA|nr:hypothetical protein FA15DRAFT_675845 [Coprinopsis marcescibilis]
MRFTSVFAALAIFSGAASALTIPLESRNLDESLSLASRDVPDLELVERALFDEAVEVLERSFYDDDSLVERSWLDEDELIARLEYDDMLEVRKSKQRKARAATAKAAGKPAKAARTANWNAANKGTNKAKTTARNDRFKNNWTAKKTTEAKAAARAAGKPEDKARAPKWKKNKNGKAVKPAFSRKGAQKGQKVFWDANAVDGLNKLGLKGKERKSVKKFHVGTAKRAMKKNGADSAHIYQLAHKNSSPHDKNMHITGKLFKGNNVAIPPTYKPPGGGAAQYHHMYTSSNDPHKLPSALKKAVIKNGKTLDQI